ncbi:hypothetical protein AMTR_s00060p00101230 [Amborella trichopoda]|uniref:Uncharacterized protein n=1 Tax=Amborella trichopoda TaxID=13333 RepID=W1NK54_AMBTC|nr:hypothetical protein AMTR_s00060p00101230 [Amborella trichopoda]
MPHQIEKSPSDYTLINMGYIFRKDLADKWVSEKVLLLDQEYLEQSIAHMNDNDDILATDEGNMVEDEDDFDKGKDKNNDDDDGAMADDWHESTTVECEVSQGTRCSPRKEDGLRLI